MSIHPGLFAQRVAAAIALLSFFAAAPGRGSADTPPAAPATQQCSGLPSGGANVSGLALFGYPIDDPGVLLLMQRLVHLSPSERKAVLNAGGSRDPVVRSQIDATVRSLCVGELVRYATLRTAVELGFVWENADDASLEKFVNGPLIAAIAAEAARATLPPDILAAALRGLPTGEPDPAASPAAAPCGPGDDVWSIRDAKEPLYPKPALKAGEIGTVKLIVALDSAGLVRFVKVRNADVDLDPAKGGGQMVYGSLISAAAARFRPGNAKCAPGPGNFVYKVDYSYNGVAVGEGR